MRNKGRLVIFARRQTSLVCLTATVVILGTLGTAAVAAAPVEEIRSAVEAILQNSDFQTELPYELPDEAETQGDAVERSIWRLRKSLTALQPVAKGLFWVIFATTLALVAVWLINEFRGAPRNARRAAAKEFAKEPVGGDVEEQVVSPLKQAEGLAEQGLYAEATHALLLWTLQELRRLLGRPLAPSLTSREILERVALPPNARGALSDLVSAVEVSYFGDQPLGQIDYQRCLASFRHFEDAFRRGAP